MAIGVRQTPIISSTEYVLGYLWARDASKYELLRDVARVRSPILSRQGVEVALRGLQHQGLVVAVNGKLRLRKNSLHPDAVRIARAIARDLEVLGVV